MTYEIYTHTFTGTSYTVIVRSDGAWIPVDSANAEYQEYLEWVADGNTAGTYSPGSSEIYSAPSDSEVMFTMEVI